MGGGRRIRGRSASVLHRPTLVHRIESCKLTDVDDIVNYLRFNYSDYRAKKEKSFTRLVQLTLNSLVNKNHKHIFYRNDEEEEAEEPQPPASLSQNKRRKMEDNVSSSFCSISRPPVVDDDEEDCSMSPDLMKDMLRNSYMMKNGNKNVELEIGDRKVSVGNEVGSCGEKSLGTVVGGEKSEGKGGLGDGMEGAKFEDFGGMDKVLEELRDNVIRPLCYPELLSYLGVKNSMTGILLHGPPGCGKTRLAHAIANEAGVPFYKVSAPELVSGVSGASEENIRALFSKACRTAPSIIFIDEIDAIASKREALQSGMEKRIVTQLMTCMDGAHGCVFVIAATNTPNTLDPALRRPGRFDKEISLPPPNEKARAEILSIFTRDLRLESSFDLLEIARSTPGFVGADLGYLVKAASIVAFKRILDKKSELCSGCSGEEDADKYLRQPWLFKNPDMLKITMADFEKAAKEVQPSLKRDGFSSIPSVKWEDVGGLNHLREKFDFDIVKAIKCPERYERFGVKPKAGYLLYGPPGCGKTLIARAVANEAGANFIYIKGAELLNKYVGESELAVRSLFRRARTCSPCIIFFDEVDGLATKRGKDGGWVVERLLNQLLVELDGEEERSGVFVIGATNRPQVIDEALLRPGRFGELLYVPPPSPEDRGLILKALARKHPIDGAVDLIEIGKSWACNNLSGADLAELMTKAAKVAVRESEVLGATSSGTIKASHFEEALGGIRRSIVHEQLEEFAAWRKSIKVA